ncbi:hypothetical protein FOL47_004946, partial [Perkinsus chesapeaki]
MSIFGHTFRVSTWGESHGLTVGCVVDGVPPGLELTEEDIQPQLDRRRPGQSTLTTARSEADEVTIMSGTENGITLGTPVAMMVKNKDQRKFDYANTTLIPRPGHADYTYQVKYGIKASSGGGRASARETIGRVAAGALAEKYLLKEFGCTVVAWVESIMDIRIPEDVRNGFKSKPPTRQEVDELGVIRQAKLEGGDEVYLIDSAGTVYDGTTGLPTATEVAVDKLSVTNTHYIRCPHGPTAARMAARLMQVKSANDSCGGAIACCISNCPVGLGEPCMDKFEAELAKGMMSLPATKGFEIGSGFEGCRTLRGSQNNDPFASGVDKDGLLHTRSNNHGGTLGGITSGMPVYFRVCIKAASSIGLEQSTADFDGHTQTLAVKGRHDPCVLPRAPPLIEGMGAMVTMDMILYYADLTYRYFFSDALKRSREDGVVGLCPFTMANLTDKGAAGAHGGNPQFLISQIVRDRVYSLRYWKEECFGLNAETILDKAAELNTWTYLQPVWSLSELHLIDTVGAPSAVTCHIQRQPEDHVISTTSMLIWRVTGRPGPEGSRHAQLQRLPHAKGPWVNDDKLEASKIVNDDLKAIAEDGYSASQFKRLIYSDALSDARTFFDNGHGESKSRMQSLEWQEAGSLNVTHFAAAATQLLSVFTIRVEAICGVAGPYVGTVYGPLQRPSPFLCLLVKLLQIAPDKEIIKSFIDLSAGDDAGELRYLRALACTYIRYIGRPEEVYNWLEPVLWDYRQIVVRKLDGSFEISNLDTWVNTLLMEDEIITLGLPKLPQRHVLEEREALKPFNWPPEVIEGLKEEPADEPTEVNQASEALLSAEANNGTSGGAEPSGKAQDQSRSNSRDREHKHRHHHHRHRHGEKKSKSSKDSEEQQEIDEANALRAKLGLKPLRISEVIATQGIQAYDIITVPSLLEVDRTSMRKIQDYLLEQVADQLKPFVIESNILYSPVKVTTPLVAVDHDAPAKIRPASAGASKSITQPVTMTISLRSAKTASKDRENGERAVYRMISKIMTTGTGLQPLSSGKSGAVMYFDTRRAGGRGRGSSDGADTDYQAEEDGGGNSSRMPVP